MRYTPGMVRKYLSEYQGLAQGVRIAPREDRLGSRPPPLDEAPWAATGRLKADIETALRELPFEHMMILFMAVCQGESSWRNGCKRYDWRRRVADWWGRAGDDDDNHRAMTPGDVNKVVEESIQEMCDSLNGVAVDNVTA